MIRIRNSLMYYNYNLSFLLKTNQEVMSGQTIWHFVINILIVLNNFAIVLCWSHLSVSELLPSFEPSSVFISTLCITLLIALLNVSLYFGSGQLAVTCFGFVHHLSVFFLLCKCLFWEGLGCYKSQYMANRLNNKAVTNQGCLWEPSQISIRDRS